MAAARPVHPFVTSRRRFLRAAGVCIALPAFESLLPTSRAARAAAKAAGPVKRFVCTTNIYGAYHKAFFPKTAGADFELPETLMPLERHRSKFTVFSHLDHGIGGGHQAVPTLLNGVMPHLANQFPEGNISLDQKAAEFVGSQTRYPSMTLSVNEANLVSITRTGVQVPSINLSQMYRALFIEDSPEAKAAEAQRGDLHCSILDAVREEAKGVRKRLGSQDQKKFDEYLDSVRSLEGKIVQQKPWIDRPKPQPPIPEPPMGKGTDADMKALMELIALAIQTDSCRIFTACSGFQGGDYGLSGGYHGFSHHGEREMEVNAVKKIERGQIDAVAHLMDLLAAQPDPINGGTLLDHTSILYGCGMAEGHHTTRDLPLLLAGGSFRHAGSLVLPEEDGKRVKAANLLLSILQDFGLEIERFGTSTGTLTGLERAQA